ncbi:MAG TPA: DUF924 family protein [Burkholderiales bacterium]|nr:DUF924 family protein [Burkholderiales bacterium]
MNDSRSWQAILDFWFGAPGSPEYGQLRAAWFKASPDFDAEIRRRFSEQHARALNGALAAWEKTPLSALSLLILLDQFSRNLYRGTPAAFAADPQALAVARSVVAQGWDRDLVPVQRHFVYLPFEHAEDLGMQNESVRLFEQLGGDSQSKVAIDYAHRHHAVIERFGRFPHRNIILERASTPEEIEFLQQPNSSF